MRTRLAALVLSALACACSAPQRQPPAGADAQAPPPPARAGHVPYTVDPAASEVRVLVYRAGALARLGHNHVITWHPEDGWVDEATGISGSALQIRVPLQQAVVDDPARRSEEGPDFPGEIPADAREGTARNMLGVSLLDAVHHPTLLIRSTAIRTHGNAMRADLLVSIAGRGTPLSVDFKLDRSSNALTAAGEFKLLQSQLGLKPFSVMLGALQVQDEIIVKFRILARRASS
jgi:polyisoprenoid-binding protein YceI